MNRRVHEQQAKEFQKKILSECRAKLTDLHDGDKHLHSLVPRLGQVIDKVLREAF